MIRSTDELLAEAKKEEQERPVREPWQLQLGNGTVVTFRDPGDVPLEDGADTGTESIRKMLDDLIVDNEERRQFWDEWGPLKTKYVKGLFKAIANYYRDVTEGKDETSSGSSNGTQTRSKSTSTSGTS